MWVYRSAEDSLKPVLHGVRVVVARRHGRRRKGKRNGVQPGVHLSDLRLTLTSRMCSPNCRSVRQTPTSPISSVFMRCSAIGLCA